jgi:hypothetical protein
MLPNDNVRANQTTLQCQHQLTTVRQDECERLNLQHIIISALMRGKLYLAPLQTDARNAPRRILDMGCGTGIWCTEMGMKFSLATRASFLLTLIVAKDFRRTEVVLTNKQSISLAPTDPSPDHRNRHLSYPRRSPRQRQMGSRKLSQRLLGRSLRLHTHAHHARHSPRL